MKSLIRAFAYLLLVTAFNFSPTSFAQEKENQPTGFDWLRQLEGEWIVKSTTPAGVAAGETRMNSRVIGNNWIVIEQNGSVNSINFTAIQSVSYDSKQKKYIGNWIDSMNGYRWEYDGSLDESGKRLTLNAEGPNWTDATKMSMYRDIYEFKSENEIATISQLQNDDGEWETFINSTITKVDPEATSEPDSAADEKATVRTTTVTPFLMFIGQAEEAIEFYKTVFPETEVASMEKYKAGEAGKEGTIKVATFVIAGQQIKCIDSPAVHEFDFTPSFSFFVECENEEQIKERFEKLAEGGKTMMPLGNYGFSQQFGWASDKFGVSWQLNLK